MKALITGASSGIGRDMAIYLSELGYDLYIVARRSERLKELEKSLRTNVIAITVDVSDEFQCRKLYEQLKDEDIDIVINNAGFGVFGPFCDTELNKELNMIDVNIKAVHIITKFFLRDFVNKNRGYILNVASAAGFMMGPLFSSYYASKSYVLRLTQAINRELSEMGSDVTISVLCPGPVKTEFDHCANIATSLNGVSSEYVAKYAIDKLLKRKNVIIPGFLMKMSVIFSKFAPSVLLSKITYICQSKKK